MTDFWFRCPKCSEARLISKDQAQAREQIQCGCGFKRTGIVSPMLSMDLGLPHTQAFEIKRHRKPLRQR